MKEANAFKKLTEQLINNKPKSMRPVVHFKVHQVEQMTKKTFHLEGKIQSSLVLIVERRY